MDKNKIIEGASKLVAKGAYDKAIKEYQKVLEADPRDVRILQKMGELFQKKNDNVEAARYFTKVAENYSNDGFFLKAVALYKQVLKLNPGLLEVNLKLAELHQQLQLMSEATNYYQLVANHYDKAGDIKASLDILKKMVDLDPDNISSREKLAELFARERMTAQAMPEFKRAADYYKKNGRNDDYLRVAEKMIALQPENLDLAGELAELYLSKGDQKRALAKLQIRFKADPRDVRTLTMLAQAFEGLGQISKTVSVYKELAKLYEEKGQASEQKSVWAKVMALDPNDPDIPGRAAAPAPAAPAPAAKPSQHVGSAARKTEEFNPPLPPPAPPPAASPRVSAPQPAAAAPASSVSRDQLGKLLTETDVYVKYGLHDKALDHLRKVFAVDPENIEAHEKAYQIYVGSGDSEQAFEQLLNVLRLCTRREDVDRAQPYLATILDQNPSHPEVATFLSVLSGGAQGGLDDTTISGAIQDDAILMTTQDEEVEVSPAPPDALVPTPEDLALLSAQQEQSLDLIEDDVVGHDGELEAPEQELLEDPSLIQYEDADEVVEDSRLEGFGSTMEAPPEDLAMIDSFTGAVEEIIDDSAVDGFSMDAPPVEAPVVDEEDPVASECDEAAFFLDQGAVEDAQEIVDTILLVHPGHARALELQQQILSRLGHEVDLAASQDVNLESSEPKDAFDLAAELAGELGDFVDEAPGSSSPGDDFQYTVEEVFTEFKKGLEKVVKPGDVDTHYDLGIAYKEMGLVDDAIQEFTVAQKGCPGTRKEIDCLSMKGMMLLTKGEPDTAVAAFEEALRSTHATGELAKGLKYELGVAWEAAGDLQKALGQFRQVAKEDPKYRDVENIIARLSQSQSPPRKTRKVGYV